MPVGLNGFFILLPWFAQIGTHIRIKPGMGKVFEPSMRSGVLLSRLVEAHLCRRVWCRLLSRDYTPLMEIIARAANVYIFQTEC